MKACCFGSKSGLLPAQRPSFVAAPQRTFRARRGTGLVHLHEDHGHYPTAQDVLDASQATDEYCPLIPMLVLHSQSHNNAVSYDLLQYQLARSQRQNQGATDALVGAQWEAKQVAVAATVQKDRADAENSMLRAKLARVTKERDRIATARDLAHEKLAMMARQFAASDSLETKQLWTSYAASRQRILALQTQNDVTESRWKKAQAEAAHQQWRCKVAQDQAAALAGVVVALLARANWATA